MIRFTIEDPEVKQCGQRDGKTGELGWAIVSHGICMAYCDTKHEAERARDAINDMARQLRGVGEKVGATPSEPPPVTCNPRPYVRYGGGVER